jgi:hypothetical protein
MMAAWTVVPARSHRAVVAARVMHALHTRRARHEVGLEDGESYPQDEHSGTHKGEWHMVDKKTAPLVARSANRLSRGWKHIRRH